jgi:hypothetical protein
MSNKHNVLYKTWAAGLTDAEEEEERTERIKRKLKTKTFKKLQMDIQGCIQKFPD